MFMVQWTSSHMHTHTRMHASTRTHLSDHWRFELTCTHTHDMRTHARTHNLQFPLSFFPLFRRQESFHRMIWKAQKSMLHWSFWTQRSVLWKSIRRFLQNSHRSRGFVSLCLQRLGLHLSCIWPKSIHSAIVHTMYSCDLHDIFDLNFHFSWLRLGLHRLHFRNTFTFASNVLCEPYMYAICVINLHHLSRLHLGLCLKRLPVVMGVRSASNLAQFHVAHDLHEAHGHEAHSMHRMVMKHMNRNNPDTVKKVSVSGLVAAWSDYILICCAGMSSSASNISPISQSQSRIRRLSGHLQWRCRAAYAIISIMAWLCDCH